MQLYIVQVEAPLPSQIQSILVKKICFHLEDKCERREERNAQDAKPHADPAEAEADEGT